MDSPNLDRALRIKTNSDRGRLNENIRFRWVQVGQVADAVVDIDFHYEEGAGGKFLPEVRSMVIENVQGLKLSRVTLNGERLASG